MYGSQVTQEHLPYCHTTGPTRTSAFIATMYGSQVTQEHLPYCHTTRPTRTSAFIAAMYGSQVTQEHLPYCHTTGPTPTSAFIAAMYQQSGHSRASAILSYHWAHTHLSIYSYNVPAVKSLKIICHTVIPLGPHAPQRL